MHELSLSRAVLSTAVAHAEGRRVTGVSVRVGRCARSCPSSLAFYFEIVARGTPCEGAQLEIERGRRAAALHACGEEWEHREPSLPLPGAAAGSDVSVIAGEELQVESIEVEEDACTAHKVRVARTCWTRTRRSPRPTARTSTARACSVVNLMSAPGAGKTTLLERVLGDLPGAARRRAGG